MTLPSCTAIASVMVEPRAGPRAGDARTDAAISVAPVPYSQENEMPYAKKSTSSRRKSAGKKSAAKKSASPRKTTAKKSTARKR
jgi:hypothetical protein